MRWIPYIYWVLCLPVVAVDLPVPAATTERMAYDITWVGVSVATMTVQNNVDEAGKVCRSVCIQNRPWLSKVYPVDTTVECTIERTADGPRHTVIKKVSEKNFVQDDTLLLWPDEGRAVWSNAVEHMVQTSSVPKGSRDLVSFLFDLRDTARDETWEPGGHYSLIMDGRINELEIFTHPPESIRTPFGRMKAISVTAESKSPELFDRNKPRAVWVSSARPVVVFADLQTRFGPVRSTLSEWERDGRPVDMKSLCGP